jgi:hypothetical protein
MPLIAFGAMTLSSGFNPSKVDGPKRSTYVIEHQIPAREGGVVEYLGSKQPTYQLKGFLAPLGDAFNGPATAVLSGTSYLALTPDASMSWLQNIRASGVPQLLRVESTWSQFSGYAVLYENDFFWVTSVTFAMEAGRGYPYYPYTVDLMRASVATYGNTSGLTSQLGSSNGDYFSGFTYASILVSGQPQGKPLAGIGLYAPTVASGDARVAVFDNGGSLKVQSAAQPVVSGWNYFPLNPTFSMTSGATYYLAFMGDATSTSGWTVAEYDVSSFSGRCVKVSGTPFLSGFGSSLSIATSGYTSGYQFGMDLVAPG